MALTTVGFMNRKGGCQKTSLVMAFADFLALKGYKVLCVDLDSQRTMSKRYGIYNDYSEDKIRSLYDVIIKGVKITDAILKVNKNYFTDVNLPLGKDEVRSAEMIKANDEARFRYGIDILPATTKVGEVLKNELTFNREKQLLNALCDLPENAYDYVIIDTAPAEDIIMFNALLASDHVFGTTTLADSTVEGVKDLIGIVQTLNKAFSTRSEKIDIPLDGIIMSNVNLATNKQQNIIQVEKLQEICKDANINLLNHIIRSHPFALTIEDKKLSVFTKKMVETKVLEDGSDADSLPKTIKSIYGEKIKYQKNKNGNALKRKKLDYPSISKDYLNLFEEMLKIISK